jgi:hypothetical protein
MSAEVKPVLSAFRPVYEAVLDRTGVKLGTRYLDAAAFRQGCTARREARRTDVGHRRRSGAPRPTRPAQDHAEARQ